MMAVQWTKSQQKAIDARGQNYLVAAGAGSGKTAVLVERVVNHILTEPYSVDIDQFLVLTFTRAAAAEMKGKIVERILQKLRENPKNTHLQKQMSLIHKADITTIHAFCSNLIRENFHLLDVSENFRIADDSELMLIKNDVVRKVLDQHYEKEGDAPFIQFLNMFTEARSDEKAAQMVLDVYERLCASPDPLLRLNEMERAFCEDPERDLNETIWGQIIRPVCLKEVEYYIDTLENQLQRIAFEDGLKKAYGEAIESDIAWFSHICDRLKNGTFDQAGEAFAAGQFIKLGAARGLSDMPEAKAAKAVRQMVKDGIGKMHKRFYGLSSSQWMEDICAVAPAIYSLLSIIRSFHETFCEQKRDRNIVDFSDLEHLALQLLRREDGAFLSHIQNRYVEILVDEYQDTNEIQECIFQLICGGRKNLFMVGDVKQSIYRFRQARPDIFLQKYLAYGEEDNGENRKICLFDNFRSRTEILDFVNDLFMRIMSPSLGEIAYTESEFLRAGREYPKPDRDEPPVEVLLIGLSKDDDDEEEPIRKEAVAVAQRIRELMDQNTQTFDAKLGKNRRLCYRDIVVLMRSVSNKAPIYEEALMQFGIPVYCDAATAYFDTVEIMTMFSMLRVIDNPRQDIPLISLMRSCVFAFTEDEVLDIRSRLLEGDMCEAVQFCADEGDEKCRSLMAWLEKCRQWASNLSVDRLIWFLYQDTGVYDLMGAMRNGPLRQANLRMLFEYARKYEKTSYKGLYNFLNFVNRLVERQGDFLPAKIIAENSDVVRIMSIHKSKGLEFPVCFLSEMGAAFNYSDVRTPMIFHDTLGFGPQYKDIDRKITYPTIAKNALGLKIEREMLCEEMRILYVSLTRAREKLIITGRMRNQEKKAETILAAAAKQGERINPVVLHQNATFLDWILFFLFHHKDGNCLRDMAQATETKLWETQQSAVFVKLANKTGENTQKEKEADEQNTAPTQENEADERYEMLKERATYVYPFPDLCKTPAKMSVTEIKGKALETELHEQTDHTGRYLPPVFREPDFLKGEMGANPARRGTAVHKVMQYLEFEKTQNVDDVAKQIEALVANGFIHKEDAALVSPQPVYRFFQSDLAKRLRNATQVWREEKFNLALDRAALLGKSQNPVQDRQKVFVQGIIDCFFEEPDGNVVIIDFKTDKLTKNDVDEIFARYRVQMRLYQKAVEEIFEKKVKNSYIYLFNTGETIVMEEKRGMC